MYASELFRMVFPLAAPRLKMTPARAKLDRCKTLEEFKTFIAAHPQARFSFYEDRTGQKQREFKALLDVLALDIRGRVMLEIGPAFGETLDIGMKERGAKRVDFIELDDCFYTWNRLKGVGKAYRGNYLRVVPRLEPGAYDFIHVRGLPQVETIWPLRGSRVGFVRLDSWLDALARIAAPGGTIVVSPNWRSSGDKRMATPDWRQHGVCQLMLDKGYRILPFIDGHNKEPEYPVTFVKTIPLAPA